MTTGHTGPGQWRVDFDAEVVFSNGGSLRTEGFRLDVPGDGGHGIDDAELGELLVRHLGLLMVGSTSISRKELVREPHKGSRNVGSRNVGSRNVGAGGGGAGGAGGSGRRTVDLTGPGTRLVRPAGAPAGLEGLVDLPVVLVRLTGAAEPVADRLALAPFAPAGHAVVVHTGRTDGPWLTPDALALLAERGAALVATDGGGRAGAGAEPPTGAVLPALVGLPVLTGLTGLADLPATGVRLHAVPYPYDGGEGGGQGGQGGDEAERVRVYAVREVTE